MPDMTAHVTQETGVALLDQRTEDIGLGLRPRAVGHGR